MDLPGYDNWKLMTPEEDYEARGGKLCPWCGAYGPERCELEEEMGSCPWDDEPDVDDLRDQCIENERMARNYPDDGDF